MCWRTRMTSVAVPQRLKATGKISGKQSSQCIICFSPIQCTFQISQCISEQSKKSASCKVQRACPHSARIVSIALCRHSPIRDVCYALTAECRIDSERREIHTAFRWWLDHGIPGLVGPRTPPAPCQVALL